jgi:hypothetical protein
MQTSLLKDESTKGSFSDYLKLLQLIKEVEGDRPREITVRWADPLWPPEA